MPFHHPPHPSTVKNLCPKLKTMFNCPTCSLSPGMGGCGVGPPRVQSWVAGSQHLGPEQFPYGSGDSGNHCEQWAPAVVQGAGVPAGRKLPLSPGPGWPASPGRAMPGTPGSSAAWTRDEQQHWTSMGSDRARAGARPGDPMGRRHWKISSQIPGGGCGRLAGRSEGPCRDGAGGQVSGGMGIPARPGGCPGPNGQYPWPRLPGSGSWPATQGV